ncbi:hypothetical protein [Phenylobacterium sp.]|uniref:hypothetical protein n=1 Tax=Phenylobacterium sp. TaxID=1871053 RepID=UPI0035C7BFD3
MITQHEAVVLMRTDCHVCRAEGLSAKAQVAISANGREVYATLYQVDDDWLGQEEAGLSESLWARLGVGDGAEITVRHAPSLESMSSVRRRIYGQRLSDGDLHGVVGDIAAGRYTDIHLAAFLTASSALALDHQE